MSFRFLFRINFYEETTFKFIFFTLIFLHFQIFVTFRFLSVSDFFFLQISFFSFFFFSLCDSVSVNVEDRPHVAFSKKNHH